MSNRRSTEEGTVAAVPLPGGGFAVAVIARSAARGVQAGFFFGPRWAEVPQLPDLSGLRPDLAILIGHFGIVGIRTGSWPVLGILPGWNRDMWRMPPLYRYQEINDAAYRVEYDDNDPSREVREARVPVEEALGRPRDSLMGHGFVESRLERIISASA